MTQETLRDIPSGKLRQVLQDYHAIGATTQVIPQGGDMFTVVATFDQPVHLSPFATPTPAEVTAVVPALHSTPVAPPRKSTAFTDLSDEYLSYFETCTVRPERQLRVDARLQKLRAGAAIYKEVGDALGGIPWFFIGIIHSLESNFDFSTHLHNGDPLSGRTVHVPEGRPQAGKPPFSWGASAKDALRMKGLDQQADWSIARMLYRWEAYNGFGYRPHGIPSAYLWSFSNHYTKGRFVSDHAFDPDSISQQCGAAVMLKALQASL